MRRHTRPRFSPRIPVYGGGLRLPSAGALSEEELCIFYLSPEIRLDPDENTGPPARTDARARRRAGPGPRTQMGLLLLPKKSAITEREGRDSWDLHMSWRGETTSPTRPGGGNEPAVHGL